MVDQKTLQLKELTFSTVQFHLSSSRLMKKDLKSSLQLMVSQLLATI